MESREGVCGVDSGQDLLLGTPGYGHRRDPGAQNPAELVGTPLKPPRNPLLTLDEGRGGGPIALHLPAGAAVAGLRGHPLPLQHVGGHRGPGCLPVHPEASFTCGYGPEPSQGLTCVGTAMGLRAEGSSPALLPAAESPPCPCTLPGSLVGIPFGSPAGAHPPWGLQPR